MTENERDVLARLHDQLDALLMRESIEDEELRDAAEGLLPRLSDAIRKARRELVPRSKVQPDLKQVRSELVLINGLTEPESPSTEVVARAYAASARALAKLKPLLSELDNTDG